MTAVNNANTVTDGTQQGLLDGFQAAVVVSVIAAGIGVIATAARLGRRPPATEAEVAELETGVEAVPEAEAA